MNEAPLDYDRLRDTAAASKPKIVIVGGGFAGLYAALGLRSADVDVTIVDQRNHHLFQPLLYQVATAALAAPDIAAPIRRILQGQKNVRVLLDRVKAVDLVARRLELERGSLRYDHLLLAPGARDHYFGHDAWKKHAPGLKTVEDALSIRSRILAAFEAAERETDAARRKILLTFVVVGGGPTGVELAGSVAEIARRTLTRDFRNFDPNHTRVILVEGGDRILPSYPPELSAKAQSQLVHLGAEVRLNAKVEDVNEDGVKIGGETLQARTVLWAAGVRAAELCAALGESGVPLDRQGRVLVEPDLSVRGHPEVFVMGDAAAVAQGDAFVPGVAPAAIQMGKHTAANVLRRVRGEPTTTFHYVDKGSLATIGRRSAVADFGRVRFSGAVAWLAWLFIHLFFLIGFRNRLAVMIEWAIAYLTYQRSARVILTESV